MTAEELDALPEGAQVLDRHDDVLTKRNGMWHSYETAPMWSAKVAKWGPRLMADDELLRHSEARTAFDRAWAQRHTWECVQRTRIGVPALDACDCPLAETGDTE